MEYVHQLNPDEGATLAPGVSTSFGIAVAGERIHVGMVNKARGTGSKLHQHPNEQITQVISGTIRFWIGKDKSEVIDIGQRE